MEMQWNQHNCSYLQRDLWETQNLEEVQEIRLSDGMPDVGRVLCAWGQPILRGKEWKNDGIAISCGVTAWILYAPEDGSEPRCLEVWIPFQAKWGLQDSLREGQIQVSCCLRFLDARVRSARKIAVRASVGVHVEALEPAQQSVFSPVDVPDGVQLLEKTYPALLPREAGEKVFSMEEEISVSGPMPRKILCSLIYPVVTEENVVGSRAVFKGSCKAKVLYMTEDGAIEKWQGSIPFAQFADLDQDYDRDAMLSVTMAVSTMDTELAENGMYLKWGLVAQYMVADRQMIRVAEDAYSPWQEVGPVIEVFQLPMILDKAEESIELPFWSPQDARAVVDQSVFPDQPVQFREGDRLVCQLGGVRQALYYDMEGNIQCATENWSQEWSLPMAQTSSAFVRLAWVDPVEQAEAALRLEALSVAQQEIPMLTNLQLGEKKRPDPNRPSLILRRAGEETLWEMAKLWGSTVETIQKVNQLSGEAALGQMLLIPIV